MADDDNTHDDNPFHLPAPSSLPIITGLGVALTLFGFVPDSRAWRLSLVSIGMTILVIGAIAWLRDALAEFNDLPD